MQDKYVDENLVQRVLEMVLSPDEGDKSIGIAIFDSLLDNKKDIDDFMLSFEALNEGQKAKMFWNIYAKIDDPRKLYIINKKYIQLCLEHTKWTMKQQQTQFNTEE